MIRMITIILNMIIVIIFGCRIYVSKIVKILNMSIHTWNILFLFYKIIDRNYANIEGSFSYDDFLKDFECCLDELNVNLSILL